MNSAVCLALLFLVVSGFPQPARRAYIPSPAVGTYEGDAVDPPPVNVPKRRIARAADALYEPPSFADERFLECCKTQGFDDACAKFMCQWQNVWRVEPGQVYTEGRTAKKCIATAPQLNAYKNCLTNFKNNRACCEATMPETMERQKRCAEICDGTRDFTAGLSLNLFQECSSFKNEHVANALNSSSEFFKLLWCNAGAYHPMKTTTHNPLNVTIDCAATRTVNVDGFKVVGCVKS
ncbi:hypothetical protein AAVH_16543 [Aphelenchoides avenae]|nr:hypothetical protein AAVH_16543 [Aphelenchus avenae]